MKAYMYFGILAKETSEGSIIEGRYGAVKADHKMTEEEVKKAAITSSLISPLICDGYTIKAFTSELIDPDIAPMNCEDTWLTQSKD